MFHSHATIAGVGGCRQWFRCGFNCISIETIDSKTMIGLSSSRRRGRNYSIHLSRSTVKSCSRMHLNCAGPQSRFHFQLMTEVATQEVRQDTNDAPEMGLVLVMILSCP
jgi:hypothetical protein